MINDIYDANRPFHDSSYACLEMCLQRNITLITSCDLVTTIYYITAKTQGKTKALAALEQIQTVFDMVPFSNRELEAALRLMRQDSDYHDLEDTIQYILAKSSSCEWILSNDVHFVAKDLKVLDSKMALQCLANN